MNEAPIKLTSTNIKISFGKHLTNVAFKYHPGGALTIRYWEVKLKKVVTVLRYGVGVKVVMRMFRCRQRVRNGDGVYSI